MRFTPQPDGSLASSPFFMGVRAPCALCGDMEPPEEHDWQPTTSVSQITLTEDIAHMFNRPDLAGCVMQYLTCTKCKYMRTVINKPKV